MRYLFLIIAFVVSVSAFGQIESSNAIIDVTTMDTSPPCAFCSPWRYDKANSVLNRWNGSAWVPNGIDDLDYRNDSLFIDKNGTEEFIAVITSGGGGAVDWADLTGIPAGFADNTDDVDDADNVIGNEFQSLSINGQNLTITSGNTVTLPTAPNSWNTLNDIPSGFDDDVDDVNDADFDPANEIQTLSINGQDLTLSDGGGTVSIPSGGTDNWNNLTNIPAGFADNVDDIGTDDQVASEVSVTPVGNLVSSNVQSALQELQTDIDGLSGGGGTDDQIASEVPVTPTGNLNSTDVQAALEEHQSDIDALGAGAADGTPTAAVYDPVNKILTTIVAAPGNNYDADLSDLANLAEVTKYHDFVITGQSRVVVANPEGPYPILYEGNRALVWNKTTDAWEQTSATNNATNNGGGNSMQWVIQQRWALDYPTDTVRYMWSATSSRDVGCWTLADNDQSGVGTNNECINNFMNELDDMPADFYSRVIFVAQGESDGSNEPEWLQKWADILIHMRTHPKIDDNAVMIFSPFIESMTNTPWRQIDSLINNTANINGLPMYASEERLDNDDRDVGSTNHPTNYGYYLSGNGLYDKYKSLTYNRISRLEELIDVPRKGFINPAQNNFDLRYDSSTELISLTNPRVAADISFTPTGNLVSSNIQAALVELQTEIDGLGGGGGTDDQTAEEVPITAIAQLPASTQVQEALTELAVNADVLSQVVASLNTLSGVAALSDDLGSFSGSTISTATTIKNALQELETALELLNSQGLGAVLANSNDANDLGIVNISRIDFDDSSLDGDVWYMREFSSDFRIEQGVGPTGTIYAFRADDEVGQGDDDVMRRKDIDHLGTVNYRYVDIESTVQNMVDMKTVVSVYSEVTSGATANGTIRIPDPIAEYDGLVMHVYNVDDNGSFSHSIGTVGNVGGVIDETGTDIAVYEMADEDRLILNCKEVSTGTYAWVLSKINQTGGGGGSTAWADITGKPSEFPSDWNLDIDINGFGLTTQLFKLTLNNVTPVNLFNPETTSINHGDIQVFSNESTGGIITVNAPSGYTVDGLSFINIGVGETYWLQADTINDNYTIIADSGVSGGGGGTDDQTAIEVPVTPTGNISSTNVQAALEEIQTELDGVGGGSSPTSGIAVIDGDTADNVELTITPGIDLDGTQVFSVTTVAGFGGSPAGTELNPFVRSIDEGADTFIVRLGSSLEPGEVIQIHWVIYD